MNKYLVFRSLDDTCDGGSTKKKKGAGVELVAVEYGYTYIEAIPDIINAINADLSELPEGKHATVSCIEETAYRAGFITKEQLVELAQPLLKTAYGKYLIEVSEGL